MNVNPGMQNVRVSWIKRDWNVDKLRETNGRSVSERWERERKRVGNTRNFDTSVEMSKKFRMSKYFAISGIRNYSVEGKKERERKKVICVNELYWDFFFFFFLNFRFISISMILFNSSQLNLSIESSCIQNC